jgi:gentisate 1,2-dioxygenase
VLYVVTNEPLLAFERLEPPTRGNAPVAVTHYTAAELDEHLERLYGRPIFDDTAGRALNLSSACMELWRTCLPSLTLTFNAVLPGESQRPHRHNAAALVLVLQQGGCYSVIGGKRLDWRDNAVVLTPPQAVHSHRNDGEARALALIVQDGGLYYHCRTMGFAFA